MGLADPKSLLRQPFKSLLRHPFSPQLKQADACLNASLQSLEKKGEIRIGFRADEIKGRKSERGDDGSVSRRGILSEKTIRINPSDPLAFAAPGVASPAFNLPYIEQDFPIGIGMADLDERPQPLDVDTHFLSQLTPEGLNCILTQLYLAAWKFP
jgi:hypothetical protein